MGKTIQGKLNYSKHIKLLITPILETWFNERLFFKTVIFIVKCQLVTCIVEVNSNVTNGNKP